MKRNSQKYFRNIAATSFGLKALSLLLIPAVPAHAETVDPSCATSNPHAEFKAADVAGDPYENHFTISFSLDNHCVQHAGIYVGTQLLREIPVHAAIERDANESSSVKSFTVEIDAALEPELRIYTADGRAVSQPIDVLDIRGM
jgi:hypothetical protein